MNELMIGGVAIVFFAAGWFLGGIGPTNKLKRLQEEYETLTDRDEKGRFKKSMRVLKHD